MWWILAVAGLLLLADIYLVGQVNRLRSKLRLADTRSLDLEGKLGYSVRRAEQETTEKWKSINEGLRVTMREQVNLNEKLAVQVDQARQRAAAAIEVLQDDGDVEVSYSVENEEDEQAK